MSGATEHELLKVHDRNVDWLHSRPGVARTGVELSTRSGDPVLKVYTNGMPPDEEKTIRDRLGRDLPVEFQELSTEDEVIPYGL